MTPPGVYGSKGRPLPGRPRPGYPANDEADLSGDEKHHYEPGHMAAPRWPDGRYGGRPYLGGRGGYNGGPNDLMPPYMGNSNRTAFYPMNHAHMPGPPFNMHPKYMGRGGKGRGYYPLPGGPQQPMDHYEGGGNYEGGPPPPYHFMPNPRFNYRNQFSQFNPHYNTSNQTHFPPHSMNMKQPMIGAGPFPPGNKLNKSNESETLDALEAADLTAGAAATSTSPNSTAAAAIVIDPELDNAVQEITTAIANATAAGKELTLNAEQQAILQKHQTLVRFFLLKF